MMTEREAARGKFMNMSQVGKSETFGPRENDNLRFNNMQYLDANQQPD